MKGKNEEMMKRRRKNPEARTKVEGKIEKREK